MCCFALWKNLVRTATAVTVVLSLSYFLCRPDSSSAQVDGADELSTPIQLSDGGQPEYYPVNAKRVEGNIKCVDCHRSEFRAARLTHHATETFDKLRSGDAAKDSREIAGKLGISLNEIAKTAICVHCHATPRVDDQGHLQVISGVACEACHGASGGDDGWLNRHAVYGPPGTQRESESPEHYLSRVTRCAAAGQNRGANAFRLARACYRCHLVWDEELVNTGEHPSGSDDFEFVAWSMGEVRHNFHLDQSSNALVSTLWTDPQWRPGGNAGTNQERVRVMYVAGQLAKLNVALENRAKASQDGDFADDMETVYDEAQSILMDIITDYSDEDENEDDGYDPDDLPPLQRAVVAVNKAREAFDEIDDPTSGSGVKQSATLFRQAADQVAAAAEEFIKRHGQDGSDLEVVDDFAPYPEDLEKENQDVVRGKAWQP